MYLFRGLGDSSSVQSLISSMAPSYGIPTSLALAVAQQESSFNQAAVSPAGAIGVMQLMPGTASDLGVNPSDVTQNIQGGLQYLQQMYQKFGNWTQALEAYNAGPAGNLAGSSGYAASILANAGDLGTDAATTATGISDTVSVDLGTDWGLPDVSPSLSGGLVAALALGGVAFALWVAS